MSFDGVIFKKSFLINGKYPAVGNPQQAKAAAETEREEHRKM